MSKTDHHRQEDQAENIVQYRRAEDDRAFTGFKLAQIGQNASRNGDAGCGECGADKDRLELGQVQKRRNDITQPEWGRHTDECDNGCRRPYFQERLQVRLQADLEQQEHHTDFPE